MLLNKWKRETSVPQTDFREESWSGKNKPLLSSDCSHIFSSNANEKELHKKSNITFLRERDMIGNVLFFLEMGGKIK